MPVFFFRISFKFGYVRLYAAYNGMFVYHEVFVGRAVVFDWVGQASKFSEWKNIFIFFIKNNSISFLE